LKLLVKEEILGVRSDRKSVAHQDVVRVVGDGLVAVERGVGPTLLRLNRHGRSHNIAAECCVGFSASSEGFAMFKSGLSRSKDEAGKCIGRSVSLSGSCLIMLVCQRLSAGEDGLVPDSSIELRSSVREGTGVSALSVTTVTSGRTMSAGSGPCSLR